MHRVNYRKILLIIIDIFAVVAACIAVCLFMGSWFSVPQFFLLCGVLTASKLIFRTYTGMWRYANSRDYIKLIIADAVGALLAQLVNEIFDAGILFVHIVTVTTVSLLAVLTLRFGYRYLVTDRLDKFENDRKKRIPVAIVGAGYAGMMLAEEFRRDKSARYFPYCYFDKDHGKIGSRINGVKVMGNDESVDAVLRGTAVKDVVIAAPSMNPDRRRELADLYISRGYNVKVYEPPIERVGLEDFGEVRNHLREIKISDLLCREQVSLDVSAVADIITGKTVLVTGGGGSIGSELCRQIASMRPARLVIVDIYENNAYDIQQELVRRYGAALCLHIEIASVRDAKKIDRIFEKYRPSLVFHAAAHKHVPLMEDCCDEAVKNNIFGTYNVVNAAEKYKTAKMILISTDKAVNPTNVMGATKRFCEMIVQSRKNSGTVYAAVRFGNVLGSNGSVIPLFQRQIEGGGPVTITDKRITRYFMTIPEAVGLVLQAGALARNAEIFVLDMGKPVKILDLAENMIRLAGYKPYEDMQIVEIGLRPGEKLYEELLMKTEELDKTSVEKVYIEKEKEISRDELLDMLSQINEALDTHSDTAVRSTLKRLVPTYKSPEEVNAAK